MALVKCKECGREVSSSAAACPNCGRKMPKKTALGTWLVCGLALFIFVTCTLNSEKAKDAEQARLAAVSPEQREAENRTKRELAELQDAQLTCEVRVKATLHDPGSAEFDDYRTFGLVSASPESSHYKIRVTLRAKNGFGALRMSAILCDIKRSGADRWISTLTEMK